MRIYVYIYFSQFSRSVVSNSGTPWTVACQASPVHHQLLEFTQTHVHWVSDAIQSSHPLLSPSPPAFNPSHHQGLFSESALHIRWPKYWSFSFNISPSNEHSGLISFQAKIFIIIRDSSLTVTTNLSANFLALPPKYIQNANTGLHPPCHMGANHQLYPRWLQ